MATVAPSSSSSSSSEEAAEAEAAAAADMFKNLRLDSEAKPFEFRDPSTKKTQLCERLVRPFVPDMLDPTSCYFPNSYPSHPYNNNIYGSYDADWGEYPGNAYTDGSEMTMGYYYPGPVPGTGSPHGFLNRMYANRFYGTSGYGFGSGGYCSYLNTQCWFAVESKYKIRGQGNGYFGYYGENIDCMKELNKGPRAMGRKNRNGYSAVAPAVVSQIVPPSENISEEKDENSITPDEEQFNQADFPVDYVDAKFFIIKSYSEDDVHNCVKYNVWSSTPNGNKKLDESYRAAQQKCGSCPIFLLFSVNASGQFVGLAEMVGPVDFDKNVEYWQQDKWSGCFPVKWHIVKDIPNNQLKHITLENNENKPVTNSRDTQEVMLDQGLMMIKIFKNYTSETCILDDFKFYEERQKSIQENKLKQQRFQKQLYAEKNCDEKKAAANARNRLPGFLSDLNKAPVPISLSNGELKPSGNGLILEAEGGLKMSQPIITTTSEKCPN